MEEGEIRNGKELNKEKREKKETEEGKREGYESERKEGGKKLSIRSQN